MLQTWAAEQITLAKESVQIEPAERQEKIPTESRKEKEWERLQGEWKRILVWKETIARAGKTTSRKKRNEGQGLGNGI